MKGMVEIQEYCLNRENTNFLLDPFVTMYAYGSALKTDFLEDAANLRLILPENIPDYSLASLKYLEERYNHPMKKVDTFSVSFGGVYSVYAFE